MKKISLLLLLLFTPLSYANLDKSKIKAPQTPIYHFSSKDIQATIYESYPQVLTNPNIQTQNLQPTFILKLSQTGMTTTYEYVKWSDVAGINKFSNNTLTLTFESTYGSKNFTGRISSKVIPGGSREFSTGHQILTSRKNLKIFSF